MLKDCFPKTFMVIDYIVTFASVPIMFIGWVFGIIWRALSAGFYHGKSF